MNTHYHRLTVTIHPADVTRNGHPYTEGFLIAWNHVEQDMLDRTVIDLPVPFVSPMTVNLCCAPDVRTRDDVSVKLYLGHSSAKQYEAKVRITTYDLADPYEGEPYE